MSLVSRCSKLEWTVQRPTLRYYSHYSHRSPSFTYKGMQFHLEFSTSRGGDYTLKISPSFRAMFLRPSGSTYSNSLITVTVQEPNQSRLGPKLSPTCNPWNPCSGRDLVIWSCSESSILNAISDFRLQGFLTLLIDFSVEVGLKVSHSITDTTGAGICSLQEKSVQTSAYENAVPCLESLSEDLSKLLDGSHEPDVVLTCGDLKVKAHKHILSIRSGVFAAMFSSDMAEKRTGTVEIEDMDQGTLDHFLRYMYTGKLADMTVDVAKGLYEAADKYALKCLATRCALYLQENLDPENACQVLVLADAHSHTDLKESVMKYILEEEIHLERSDRWSAFCKSHPVLALGIYDRYHHGSPESSETPQQKKRRVH